MATTLQDCEVPFKVVGELVSSRVVSVHGLAQYGGITPEMADVIMLPPAGVCLNGEAASKRRNNLLLLLVCRVDEFIGRDSVYRSYLPNCCVHRCSKK